jgi:hypothetical protein
MPWLRSGEMDEATPSPRRALRRRVCLSWIMPALAAAVVASGAAAEPREEARGGPLPTRPERPDAGAEGSPLREFNDVDGRLCRVYARRVVIDGTSQPAFATVCRTANGRWVLSR